MPTTPPSLTLPSAAPDPNDRSTYNTRAYPWSVSLGPYSTSLAALATNVYDNATEAVNAAALAVPAAAAAEAASNATLWVSGTTYAAGDVVWSPINALSYRRKSAGTGTTDPSADSANWASLAGGVPSLMRVARTSNTMLVAADKGKLIDITSGTFTQTFDAAATLGDGWWCYLRNSGTGDITLDPNASETIDGLTSFVMYPGEVRLVQCDGSALRSVVVHAFCKVFDASGTFTKPPGYSVFEGMLWGGGAGAKWASWFDGSDTRYRQYGGGGGGCMPFLKRASELAATETVTVGAGGVRTTTHNATANAGGNSVFAGVTAFGGDSSGNGGGTVTGVSAGSIDGWLILNSSSQNIAVNFVGTPIRSSQGANPTLASHSFYGGGGSMGATDSLSANSANGAGGFSTYGGGGGASVNGVRGGSIFGGRGADASNAAEIPGGGGHGSSVAAYGNGARGEVRIWGVI